MFFNCLRVTPEEDENSLMLAVAKANAKAVMDSYWFLMHGTIVLCKERENIENTIIEYISEVNVIPLNYYAFNIAVNIWEIQFDLNLFPKVYVLVYAKTSCEACSLAKHSIMLDLCNVQIVNKKTINLV